MALHVRLSSCVTVEDKVASFDGLVAGKAGVVHRLVGGFAVVKVSDPRSSACPLSFHWALLMPTRETKHDVAECDPPFRAVVTQERLSWHLASSTSPSRLKPSRQVDGKR